MAGKKNTLEGRVFDSLDAMMAAYASEAVRLAHVDGEDLDYSGASIDAVESCLESMASALSSDPGAKKGSVDFDYHARIWGAYLGEVVRKQYGGEWQMTQYPGSALAVPTLEVRGSHLYPTMKVFRRLTMGESENIVLFYQMIEKRLRTPPSIH